MAAVGADGRPLLRGFAESLDKKNKAEEQEGREEGGKQEPDLQVAPHGLRDPTDHSRADHSAGVFLPRSPNELRSSG